MLGAREGFCPHCGSARKAWAKFCGACGKPYDPPLASVDHDGPTDEPIEDDARPRRFGRWTLPIQILALVAIGGLGYLIASQARPGSILSPGVAPANLPPAGMIWFGSSFDPTTFEIRDRTTTIGAHQAFSAVAHLSRSMDGSQLAVRLSWNGAVVSAVGVSWKGSGEVWGFSQGPLSEPGVWKYELTDVGGNVLASGEITAT